ncbi:MAG: pullulanase [Cyclobacteriaceae bacterium]|jgi:pullulanase
MCKSLPGRQQLKLGISDAGETAMLTLWSSTAVEVRLKIYREGTEGEVLTSIDFQSAEDGYWQVEIEDEWWDNFYTVQIFDGEKWLDESIDPYAKFVGVNGTRGFFGDPSLTQPAGWNDDTWLAGVPREKAIIYELHVRDFSIDPQYGFQYPGKFLAFTERGLLYQGLPIGVDHLVELGVTHIHLLPVFDYGSIDETRLDQPVYNWGYDPVNYNVPEGSYSTNPYDPYTRVKEFKTLVQALHQAGIGVIMDVVYNHTGASRNSSFNLLDPGYYYRKDAEGEFSNASACGNETASEAPMMRRYIIESMQYWMEEYHIDGFRIDLMGIYDLETINELYERLTSINRDVILYGEGWAAGVSPYPAAKRALKGNAKFFPSVGVFSDEFRDGLKGQWTNHKARGFVSGAVNMSESVKFGLTGAVWHNQIDYSKVIYTDEPWASSPKQMISYISCHDGLTLADKIKQSVPEASEKQRVAMHKLASTLVMTSMGIPLIHAGGEFARSKQMVDNSFESPDTINQIDWSMKLKHQDLYLYMKQLIAFRKDHNIFQLTDAAKVNRQISFLEVEAPQVIAMKLSPARSDSVETEMLLLFNGAASHKSMQLPPGQWRTIMQNGAFLRIDTEGAVQLDPSSATILVRAQ